MRIVVCIKQVPEETIVDKQRGILRREGIRGVINPCDKNALELALSLKEKHGGTILLLTMGPPQAESSLIEGLAMGADSAILLSNRAFAGADTLATSFVLATAIRRRGDFDLILCGKETSDSGTGSVGPQLAEYLGIPQITSVAALELIEDKIRARRLMGDEWEVVEVIPPVLSTVMKGINAPRSPTYGDVIAAANKEILRWKASDLEIPEESIGLRGSPTKIVEVFPPQARRQCQMLRGKAGEVAQQMVTLLRDKGVIG